MKLTNTLTIRNELGLHARAATELAKMAQKFEAAITIDNGQSAVNATSVLGLMMLQSGQGKEILVTTEGNDAEAAMTAISELVEQGFYEN